MKDTERRIKALEFIETDDSKVIVNASLVFCLNNIAQRLYELNECYRFFYFGLGASPESILEHRGAIEIRFPCSIEESFNNLHEKASLLANSNFIVNLVQIVNDEMIEILTVMLAWRLAKAKTKYADLKLQVERLRARLEKGHFPTLLNELEKEVGPLTFREQLASINKVRKAFIHRRGCVEDEILELKLYVPMMLADFSMAVLQNPLTTPPLSKDMFIGKHVSVSWKKGDYIALDYEMCFKIAFTALSFFGNAILVKAAISCPELVPINQTIQPTGG